jgi:glutathione S-transferase
MPESPPSRAVLMTAAAVGLELNLILTDVLKGEQKTPEFMKVQL